MADRLSELLRAQHLDPGASRRKPADVLLWWEAPRPKTSPELLWVTQTSYRLDAPGGDPLVFRLEKQQGAKNAFALGVTLGRTPNNDVMVDDVSVSRFHAYFQRDPHSSVWHVVDAESSNGTTCDGVRLQPKRPAPIPDGAELRFGAVKLTFLSAASFEKLLAERASGQRRKSK